MKPRQAQCRRWLRIALAVALLLPLAWWGWALAETIAFRAFVAQNFGVPPSEVSPHFQLPRGQFSVRDNGGQVIATVALKSGWVARPRLAWVALDEAGLRHFGIDPTSTKADCALVRQLSGDVLGTPLEHLECRLEQETPQETVARLSIMRGNRWLSRSYSARLAKNGKYCTLFSHPSVPGT